MAAAGRRRPNFARRGRAPPPPPPPPSPGPAARPPPSPGRRGPRRGAAGRPPPAAGAPAAAPGETSSRGRGAELGQDLGRGRLRLFLRAGSRRSPPQADGGGVGGAAAVRGCCSSSSPPPAGAPLASFPPPPGRRNNFSSSFSPLPPGGRQPGAGAAGRATAASRAPPTPLRGSPDNFSPPLATGHTAAGRGGGWGETASAPSASFHSRAHAAILVAQGCRLRRDGAAAAHCPPAPRLASRRSAAAAASPRPRPPPASRPSVRGSPPARVGRGGGAPAPGRGEPGRVGPGRRGRARTPTPTSRGEGRPPGGFPNSSLRGSGASPGREGVSGPGCLGGETKAALRRGGAPPRRPGGHGGAGGCRLRPPWRPGAQRAVAERGGPGRCPLPGGRERPPVDGAGGTAAGARVCAGPQLQTSRFLSS